MSDPGTLQTRPRYLTSYEARWAFHDAIQHPPDVIGVEDAIDLHCHAHQGQQDPIDLARFASRSKMGGPLYKTLDTRAKPMVKLREIQESLHRWADTEKLEPVRSWAGLVTGKWMGRPSPA